LFGSVANPDQTDPGRRAIDRRRPSYLQHRAAPFLASLAVGESRAQSISSQQDEHESSPVLGRIAHSFKPPDLSQILHNAHCFIFGLSPVTP
jgi:hypothetical protein